MQAVLKEKDKILLFSENIYRLANLFSRKCIYKEPLKSVKSGQALGKKFNVSPLR